MLDLKYILKFGKMMEDCGKSEIPVPRDHCSSQWYVDRRMEEIRAKQEASRRENSNEGQESNLLDQGHGYF